MNALRWLAAHHGHLGWLAAVALAHPAWLLRRGRPLTRGSRAAVLLSGLLVLGAFALGAAIYGAYRERVKRPLFAASPSAGLLFETKEHLAFVVICLTAGAAAAALLAPRERGDLRRAAAALYAAAALLCAATAAIGGYVAAVRDF